MSVSIAERAHERGAAYLDRLVNDREKWPNREPLPGASRVPPLPEEMLPEVLRPWLIDIAHRACLPVEMVSAPAIVMLGAVVGRVVGIRPERADRWTVVPNLWGGVVALPGSLKSHVIEAGLAPIKRLAQEAIDAYRTKLSDRDARIEAMKAEIDVARKTMRAKKPPRAIEEYAQDIAVMRKQLAELEEDSERRYMTQDATVEKLGELLSRNPRGLLVCRDELAGWLSVMDRAGREGDREFYLEAWNGDGAYSVDRISRGTLHIPALTISLMGGIQPGKLCRYVREATGNGAGADGLLQRLQILIWPDSIGEWDRPTGPPDDAPRARVDMVVNWLDSVLPEQLSLLGAEQDSPYGIPYFRFAEGGQEVFDRWREELEHRLRSGELDSMPAFAAHLSKYRSLMPTLALLFHLLDVADGAVNSGAVSEECTRLAADWCSYLELHARKAYSPETAGGEEAAAQLAKRIEKGAVSDGMTIRDLYRHGWVGLATPDSLAAGMRVLSEANWIRIESLNTGGRPSEVIRLHPDLRAGG